MARNATLKALAKEDCFTSTSGQRHDVDMSAGTNHESARRGRVHEALRPLQGVRQLSGIAREPQRVRGAGDLQQRHARPTRLARALRHQRQPRWARVTDVPA